MRFQRLDLNLLVALDALLEEGKITEAAYRLNLSQSAMSSALSRLRDYFKDPLFVPVGRGMMATPLALELQKPVRETLLHVQLRIASRPAFDPATATRRIAVATSDYFVHLIGAKLGQHLQPLAPKLRIEFWPMERATQTKLDRGEIDIVFSPRHLLAEDKPIANLFSEDFVAISCERNEQVGSRLDPETFQALGHVACQFGPDRTPGAEQQWIDRAGLERRCEVTIENFSMLPALVIGTQRIAVIQRRLAEQQALILPIKVAELPFAAPLTEAMQWQVFNTSDQLHRWLRQTVKEIVKRDIAPAAADARITESGPEDIPDMPLRLNRRPGKNTDSRAAA